MSTKLIVTNEGALRGKYRAEGWRVILKAVHRMIQADAARGITTKLVSLDDPAEVKNPVVDMNDPEETKKAIDQAFVANKRPDYLMILGAPDVVAQQDLRNPVPGSVADGDPDRTVPSDLPYACDVTYSRNIKDFVGPTRVVGRLPNVKGDDDPKYLIDLLDSSATYKSRDRTEYDRFFSCTAKVWLASTKLSLREIFNTSNGVFISPADGPKYKVGDLDALMHFINCHGAFEDWHFYGQETKDSPTDPVSHDATLLSGKITPGTVAAFECCYGGDLYAIPPKGNVGIANTYLQNGAYGVWGSTTIAYGPADTNAEADLICQYFLQQVRDGASLGRAGLVARQEFIKAAGRLSLTELKTLEQFVLLGDPSIHPVTPPPSDELVVERDVHAKGALRFSAIDERPISLRRDERRTSLAKAGLILPEVIPVASEPQRESPDAEIRALFEQMQKGWPVADGMAVASYGYSTPAGAIALGRNFGKMRAATPRRVHTAVARLKAPERADTGRKTPRLMVMSVEEHESGRFICRRTFGK
jgi:hypothetical protein